MQEAMKRFKEQNKSRDPRQPRGWAAQPRVNHCAGRTPPWTGERQPEAPKRTTSLWAAQHSLGRRFPPAPAPGELGVSPGPRPVSPSCPLQPLLRHLPPPRTWMSSTSSQQRHPTAPKRAKAAGANAPWVDAAQGRHTHTDQGQKSHQIIGKQRACNNEKRTDFVTNHFFL